MTASFNGRMALSIARKLARNGIRNMTIAPGIFGTLQDVQDALAASVPFRAAWARPRTAPSGCTGVRHQRDAQRRGDPAE